MLVSAGLVAKNFRMFLDVSGLRDHMPGNVKCLLEQLTELPYDDSIAFILESSASNEDELNLRYFSKGPLTLERQKVAAETIECLPIGAQAVVKVTDGNPENECDLSWACERKAKVVAVYSPRENGYIVRYSRDEAFRRGMIID